MSTPATIPMINGTGEAYDIPMENMPDALKSGLQLAVDMKHAGTGERYTIPNGRYKEALASGMVPDHAPSGPPVPEGMQQTPSAASRFLYAAGANLPSPSGLLDMMRNMSYGNPTGLGKSGGVVQGFANDAATHPAVQLATSPHLAADAGSQVAGLGGFNTHSIASDYRNSDYAGMAGDVLSPAAQLLASMKLGARGEQGATPAGDALRSTGENMMNKFVLKAKAKNLQFGANPAEGVLENTSGMAFTKQGLADKIDDALYNQVGPQIGDAYKSADARGETISPDELRNGTAHVFEGAKKAASALGGSDDLVNQVNSQQQRLMDLATQGHLTPSQLWEQKMMLDKNTNWRNPSDANINEVKQLLSSSLGDILDKKAPEVIEPNRSYQNLKQASKLQNANAEKSPSIFGTLVKAASSAELRHLLAGDGAAATLVGATAIPLATSTPFLSGASSALYHSGALADRALPAAYGAAIRNALTNAPNKGAAENSQKEQDGSQGVRSVLSRMLPLSATGR
jgi:hypothetical protein